MKALTPILLATLATLPLALSSPPVAAPTQAALPGGSLYQLQTTLTDHEGKEIPLHVFQGHPTLVALFYASCPSACPLLVQDLKSLEARLDPAVRQELRVLLISLRPTADTPDKLKEAMERYQGDPQRWKMARPTEASLPEIAAALGVSYRDLPGGEVNHTSAITLLDRQGVPAARLEGLRQPPDGLISRLNTLVGAR